MNTSLHKYLTFYSDSSPGVDTHQCLSSPGQQTTARSQGDRRRRMSRYCWCRRCWGHREKSTLNRLLKCSWNKKHSNSSVLDPDASDNLFTWGPGTRQYPHSASQCPPLCTQGPHSSPRPRHSRMSRDHTWRDDSL